jgi:hypothetical protein
MATDTTMLLLGVVIVVGSIGSLVVFAGTLLLSGLSSKSEEERTQPAAPPRVAQEAPTFYEWHPPNLPIPDEVLLRQIEHHLRREALIAEHFIQNPSSETLRATEHQVRVH